MVTPKLWPILIAFGDLIGSMLDDNSNTSVAHHDFDDLASLLEIIFCIRVAQCICANNIYLPHKRHKNYFWPLSSNLQLVLWASRQVQNSVWQSKWVNFQWLSQDFWTHTKVLFWNRRHIIILHLELLTLNYHIKVCLKRNVHFWVLFSVNLTGELEILILIWIFCWIFDQQIDYKFHNFVTKVRQNLKLKNCWRWWWAK